MRGVPTVADALDLYARAAYYHRVYLGDDVPDDDLPRCLWERRPAYYSEQALAVAVRLQTAASDAMLRAMLGVENAYGDEARALTTEEVRVRALTRVGEIRAGQVALDRLMLAAAIRALGKILGPPEPVRNGFGFIEVVTS